METISKKATAITDRKLSQQVYSLTQALRKPPLTIANKHDVLGFQTALRLDNLIPELHDALSR